MKILFFAVFLVEVCLSHARGDVSGKQSQWLSEMTGVKEGVLRRLAHVVLFFLLSLFSGLGFGVWGIGAVFVWALLDEVTKIPIPGRHFSWLDVGLNMVGAAVGSLWYLLLRN